MGLVLVGYHSVQAQVVRQLSDVKQVRFSFLPSGINDAGTAVYFHSTDDPFGDNPGHASRIVRWDFVHNTGSQLDGFEAFGVSMSDTGDWIAFTAITDAVGQNSDRAAGLFLSAADGTSVLQLTDGLSISRFVLSGSANRVVFISPSDPFGDLASSPVVADDGSVFEQITADSVCGAGQPDISGSGSLIVYVSTADPLGRNPQHNDEIFLYESASGSTFQLTETAEGSMHFPRISQDGRWVYFRSRAPFVGRANPVMDLYRVSVATVVVDRVGGLQYRAGGVTLPGSTKFDSGLAVSADGNPAVLVAATDWTGQNADRSVQTFLIDFSTPARIHVRKPVPTLVSWDVEAGPLSYDVIRGDAANLRPGPDTTVDLGAVVCLENGSLDASTSGFEDTLEPAPGQCLLFLYRGSQGPLRGSGSWGHGGEGGERLAGSGSCE